MKTKVWKMTKAVSGLFFRPINISGSEYMNRLLSVPGACMHAFCIAQPNSAFRQTIRTRVIFLMELLSRTFVRDRFVFRRTVL